MTPKKALFDVISFPGDLVIAYRTNFAVIVPKAFRTFHDQCPVHIRVLAMFTGNTFRVKGGGRFRATTFCFLTVVFSVVVALLGCLQLQRHSQKPPPPPPPPPDFQYPMNSPHYYSRYRKYFLHFSSLSSFLLNHLTTFCSSLKLYRFLALQVHLETYSALEAW